MNSVWSHHATVIDSPREHSEEVSLFNADYLNKLKALIFKVRLTWRYWCVFFSLFHDKVLQWYHHVRWCLPKTFSIQTNKCLDRKQHLSAPYTRQKELNHSGVTCRTTVGWIPDVFHIKKYFLTSVGNIISSQQVKKIKIMLGKGVSLELRSFLLLCQLEAFRWLNFRNILLIWVGYLTGHWLTH